MATTDTPTSTETGMDNALVVTTPDGELHQKSEEYVQNIIGILSQADLFLQAVAYRMQYNPKPDDAQKLELGLRNVQKSVEEQLKNISDFEAAYHEGKVNAAGEKPGSVGAPGPWAGLIPIYGSGRTSINDFENQRYGWGVFNGVLALADITLVKDIIEGVAKGGLNIGLRSFKWSATRSRLTSSRTVFGLELEPFAKRLTQEEKALNPGRSTRDIHHWLFHQNEGIGRWLPDWIKNQGFNLLPIEPPAGVRIADWHNALHGRSKVIQLSVLRRLWYGSPDWPKLIVVSYGGRSAVYSLDEHQ